MVRLAVECMKLLQLLQRAVANRSMCMHQNNTEEHVNRLNSSDVICFAVM